MMHLLKMSKVQKTHALESMLQRVGVPHFVRGVNPAVIRHASDLMKKGQNMGLGGNAQSIQQDEY
jgi:hypothetical protein